MERRACVLAAAPVMLVLAGLGAQAQQRPQRWQRLGDGILLEVVPPERIPPLNQPQFVTAAEAEAFMRADEPVIGLFDGQVAKAYSLWQLDRHEVVNDASPVHGPIAVTW